eukprot:4224727-Pyramimonas_sp.AAC.1
MQPGHALLKAIWAVRGRSNDSSDHLRRLMLPWASMLQRHDGVNLLGQLLVRSDALLRLLSTSGPLVVGQ